MASPRYTLNINLNEDDLNSTPVKKTRKQKIDNFLFYYKWPILIGIGVLAMVIFFIADVSGIQHADIKISILSDKYIPEDAIDAFESGLAALASDYNGDGHVVINVAQYSLSHQTNDASADTKNVSTSESIEDIAQQTLVNPYDDMASTVGISADLQSAQSIIFLTDDIEFYQSSLSVFEYNDGNVPDDLQSVDYDKMGVPFTSAPTIDAINFGTFTDYDGTTHDVEAFFSDFVLVKRTLTGTALENEEDAVNYYNYCSDFYNLITS